MAWNCNLRVTALSQPYAQPSVVTYMVAHSVAALLYLSIVTVVHAELAHDPTVRHALWKLLQDAHYGFAQTEEAMFIVRGADGTISFVRWDPMGVPRHAQWNAPLPLGVVAIVHTHPNSMPRPSTTDILTAQRSELPVYVVTRTKIMNTSGGETNVVLRGDWWASARVDVSAQPHYEGK